MYIAWHFNKRRPVGQFLGVFDSIQKAQEVCSVGDCYYPVVLNTSYPDETEILGEALYKCPSGKFQNCNEYLREVHEQKEQATKNR